MMIPLVRPLICVLSFAMLLCVTQASRAEETPSAAEALLKDAELVGSGPIAVYRRRAA